MVQHDAPEMTISVVIPTRNRARRLRLALDESQQQARRAETVSGLLVDAFGQADPMRRTVDRETGA